jgi:hypothetical protein
VNKYETEFDDGQWRKSVRSGGNNGDCVEANFSVPGLVGVRDSKDLTRAPLVYTLDEWRAFVGGVKDGEFDA